MEYRWPGFQRPIKVLKEQRGSLAICIIHLWMYNIKNSIQELLNWNNELKPILNSFGVKVWRGMYRIFKALSLR